MRNFIISFMLSILTTFSFACHNVTMTETSTVDNGNGTYTYTFDICGGIEQTYGFYFDFTGPGTLVSYSASITGPTTLNILSASVPPISGVGDLEYGDWDNVSSPPFSNGNECTTITVTFDDVIDGVTMGVRQQVAGNCTETISTTNCFASMSPMYTMVIDMPNCSGNVDIILDGVVIELNIPADGAIHTFIYCGTCGTTMRIYAPKFGPFGCGGGIDGYSIYNQSGTLIQSGGSNYPLPNGNPSPYIDIDVTCPNTLPIEMGDFWGESTTEGNILNWTTITELDNDYFNLSYSQNGVDFTVLTQIKGAGPSQSPKNYRFIHTSPPVGIGYYKITQVDYSGESEEFPIIAINRLIKGILFSDIFPNPSTNVFFFNYNGKMFNTPINVKIESSLGVIIMEGEIDKYNNSQSISFDLNGVNKGIYLVKITQGNNSETKRLLLH